MFNNSILDQLNQDSKYDNQDYFDNQKNEKTEFDSAFVNRTQEFSQEFWQEVDTDNVYQSSGFGSSITTIFQKFILGFVAVGLLMVLGVGFSNYASLAGGEYNQARANTVILKN